MSILPQILVSNRMLRFFCLIGVAVALGGAGTSCSTDVSKTVMRTGEASPQQDYDLACEPGYDLTVLEIGQVLQMVGKADLRGKPRICAGPSLPGTDWSISVEEQERIHGREITQRLFSIKEPGLKRDGRPSLSNGRVSSYTTRRLLLEVDGISKRVKVPEGISIDEAQRVMNAFLKAFPIEERDYAEFLRQQRQEWIPTFISPTGEADEYRVMKDGEGYRVKLEGEKMTFKAHVGVHI
jgi:hypothetical protein